MKLLIPNKPIKIYNPAVYLSSPVVLVSITSAPFKLALKPPSSVGMVFVFCAFLSAKISSVKNSTSSFSAKKKIIMDIQLNLISAYISYELPFCFLHNHNYRADYEQFFDRLHYVNCTCTKDYGQVAFVDFQPILEPDF